MSAITDHNGKTSQGRIGAITGLVISGLLAFGPWLGYPEPSFDVLVLFVMGPGGLALWQKLGASEERLKVKPPPVAK